MGKDDDDQTENVSDTTTRRKEEKKDKKKKSKDVKKKDKLKDGGDTATSASKVSTSAKKKEKKEKDKTATSTAKKAKDKPDKPSSVKKEKKDKDEKTKKKATKDKEKRKKTDKSDDGLVNDHDKEASKALSKKLKDKKSSKKHNDGKSDATKDNPASTKEAKSLKKASAASANASSSSVKRSRPELPSRSVSSARFNDLIQKAKKAQKSGKEKEPNGQVTDLSKKSKEKAKKDKDKKDEKKKASKKAKKESKKKKVKALEAENDDKGTTATKIIGSLDKQSPKKELAAEPRVKKSLVPPPLPKTFRTTKAKLPKDGSSQHSALASSDDDSSSSSSSGSSSSSDSGTEMNGGKRSTLAVKKTAKAPPMPVGRKSSAFRPTRRRLSAIATKAIFESSHSNKESSVLTMGKQSMTVRAVKDKTDDHVPSLPPVSKDAQPKTSIDKVTDKPSSAETSVDDKVHHSASPSAAKPEKLVPIMIDKQSPSELSAKDDVKVQPSSALPGAKPIASAEKNVTVDLDSDSDSDSDSSHSSKSSQPSTHASKLSPGRVEEAAAKQIAQGASDDANDNGGESSHSQSQPLQKPRPPSEHDTAQTATSHDDSKSLPQTSPAEQPSPKQDDIGEQERASPPTTAVSPVALTSNQSTKTMEDPLLKSPKPATNSGVSKLIARFSPVKSPAPSSPSRTPVRSSPLKIPSRFSPVKSQTARFSHVKNDEKKSWQSPSTFKTRVDATSLKKVDLADSLDNVADNKDPQSPSREKFGNAHGGVKDTSGEGAIPIPQSPRSPVLEVSSKITDEVSDTALQDKEKERDLSRSSDSPRTGAQPQRKEDETEFDEENDSSSESSESASSSAGISPSTKEVGVSTLATKDENVEAEQQTPKQERPARISTVENHVLPSSPNDTSEDVDKMPDQSASLVVVESEHKRDAPCQSSDSSQFPPTTNSTHELNETAKLSSLAEVTEPVNQSLEHVSSSEIHDDSGNTDPTNASQSPVDDSKDDNSQTPQSESGCACALRSGCAHDKMVDSSIATEEVSPQEATEPAKDRADLEKATGENDDIDSNKDAVKNVAGEEELEDKDAVADGSKETVDVSKEDRDDGNSVEAVEKNADVETTDTKDLDADNNNHQMKATNEGMSQLTDSYVDTNAAVAFEGDKSKQSASTECCIVKSGKVSMESTGEKGSGEVDELQSSENSGGVPESNSTATRKIEEVDQNDAALSSAIAESGAVEGEVVQTAEAEKIESSPFEAPFKYDAFKDVLKHCSLEVSHPDQPAVTKKGDFEQYVHPNFRLTTKEETIFEDDQDANQDERCLVVKAEGVGGRCEMRHHLHWGTAAARYSTSREGVILCSTTQSLVPSSDIGHDEPLTLLQIIHTSYELPQGDSSAKGKNTKLFNKTPLLRIVSCRDPEDEETFVLWAHLKRNQKERKYKIGPIEAGTFFDLDVWIVYDTDSEDYELGIDLDEENCLMKGVGYWLGLTPTCYFQFGCQLSDKAASPKASATILYDKLDINIPTGEPLEEEEEEEDSESDGSEYSGEVDDADDGEEEVSWVEASEYESYSSSSEDSDDEEWAEESVSEDESTSNDSNDESGFDEVSVSDEDEQKNGLRGTSELTEIIEGEEDEADDTKNWADSSALDKDAIEEVNDNELAQRNVSHQEYDEVWAEISVSEDGSGYEAYDYIDETVGSDYSAESHSDITLNSTNSAFYLPVDESEENDLLKMADRKEIHFVIARQKMVEKEDSRGYRKTTVCTDLSTPLYQAIKSSCTGTRVFVLGRDVKKKLKDGDMIGYMRYGKGDNVRKISFATCKKTTVQQAIDEVLPISETVLPVLITYEQVVKLGDDDEEELSD